MRCRFEEYRLALGVLVVVDRPPLPMALVRRASKASKSRFVTYLLVAFIRKLDAVVGNNLVYLSILVPFRLSMPDEDDQLHASQRDMIGAAESDGGIP